MSFRKLTISPSFFTQIWNKNNSSLKRLLSEPSLPLFLQTSQNNRKKSLNERSYFRFFSERLEALKNITFSPAKVSQKLLYQNADWMANGPAKVVFFTM